MRFLSFLHILGVLFSISPPWCKAQTWEAMGNGIPCPTYAMAMHRDTLYAATVCSYHHGDLWWWDGTAAQWHRADTLHAPAHLVVHALASWHDTLFLAGYFADLNGAAGTNALACWTAGTSFRSVGGGFFGNGLPRVTTLVPTDSFLFAGGSFPAFQGNPNWAHLVRWNAVRWDSVIPPSDASTYWAGAVWQGHAFVGGAAPSIAGIGPVHHLLAFAPDGATVLAPIGGGLWGPIAPSVRALSAQAGALGVGGVFESAGGVAAPRVALWDGQTWHALAPDAPAPPLQVEALAYAQGTWVVAGYDDRGSSIPDAINIAYFHNGGWHALGAPFAGPISALMVVDGQLVAAGDFLSIGGQPRWNVARWQGPLVAQPEAAGPVGAFHVWPNPATDAIWADCPKGLDVLCLRDATGRLRETWMPHAGGGQQEFELPAGLAAGVYALEATSPRGRWLQRIVVR